MNNLIKLFEYKKYEFHIKQNNKILNDFEKRNKW